MSSSSSSSSPWSESSANARVVGFGLVFCGELEELAPLLCLTAFLVSLSESLSKAASMALIFLPGVSISGELAAADADRVDRGVDWADIMNRQVCLYLKSGMN